MGIGVCQDSMISNVHNPCTWDLLMSRRSRPLDLSASPHCRNDMCTLRISQNLVDLSSQCLHEIKSRVQLSYHRDRQTKLRCENLCDGDRLDRPNDYPDYESERVGDFL